MDIQTLKIELDKVSRRKVVNSRFKLLQNIGQGQFGKVLLAQDLSCTEKQQYVAIKTINRVDTARLITKTYLSHTTKIKREIQIMKECAHPNVVKLLHVIDDMKYDKILLVLEYCALGEIDWKKYNHYHEKYLKDASKRLCLNRVLRDVANGLEYLHSYKNIIHRDLKPSNLLISSDRTIKISDFGVSLILENNANDDKELGKTMGTPAFFAPELCQFVNNRLSSFNETDLMRSKIDARIDIWSLGVTLYCLFFHQLPFEGVNEFDLFIKIVNNELSFPATRRSSMAKPDDVTELALLEDLIRGLLAKKPSKRLTLAQIKNHGFTTFDISGSEIETFRNFNHFLASEQAPMSSDGENKVTQRLRRLFISRSDHSSPTDSDTTANSDSQTLVTRAGLESVDDLLDSYLDDSSSFDSVDDDDTEPVVVATKDFFDPPKTPENCSRYADAALRIPMPGNAASSKDAPVSLKLSGSNFDFSKPKVSPFSQTTNGVRTPTSAHPIVTIGPDSPSSATSVFSPSRRFFLKFKKRSPDPTISTLSGNMADSIHMKLTPPPLFGGKSSQSCRNSMTSIDSGGVSSRKNSISSNMSGTFSRISSSSSSLNLHAYLIGSPDASPKETYCTKASRREKHDSESSDGDADITLSMDQFLGQLEN